MDDLKYRMREIWYRLFYTGSKARRLLSRLIALLLISVFATIVAPTLAEELTGGNQVNPAQSSPTGNAEPSPSESSTPSESPEPTQITPTPTSSSSMSATQSPTIAASDAEISGEAMTSDSPTAKVEPQPAPLGNQPKYILRIPNSASVDPRARSYFLPQILAYPTNPTPSTLACITGEGVLLDLLEKGKVEALEVSAVEVVGDRSNQILLTGDAMAITKVINAAGGLQIYSNTTGVANKSVLFQFVALSKPVLDPAFCSAARSSARLDLRPLGLAQSTVKGGGKLK